MYPFPPSSFHIFIYLREKNNINLHPPSPSIVKKKEGKKLRCTLSLVAQ
jgi:hypothetical protein